MTELAAATLSWLMTAWVHTLVLLALALNFSVIASRQSKQITRLAQQSAIESLDDLEHGPAAEIERPRPGHPD